MTAPLTDEQLAALAALEKAAARAPWRRGTPGDTIVCDEPSDESPGLCAETIAHYGGHLVAESIAQADVHFIIAARNALPVLVAEVVRLRAERERTQTLEGLVRVFLRAHALMDGGADPETHPDIPDPEAFVADCRAAIGMEPEVES